MGIVSLEEDVKIYDLMVVAYSKVLMTKVRTHARI